MAAVVWDCARCTRTGSRAFSSTRGKTCSTALDVGEAAILFGSLSFRATSAFHRRCGAAVDLMDATHEGTPLDWAVYGWASRRAGQRERRTYHETVARLVRAGSPVRAEWLAEGVDRVHAGKVVSDSRMATALRGDLPSGVTLRPIAANRQAPEEGNLVRIVRRK
jgi:hypothetical protein